ncbi:hypothetical protein GGH12_004724 [Coemansia sp. RSA 1822]|nr:hypothetical protein GGH12_004724 [Coemansia sp. RSA 1822]
MSQSELSRSIEKLGAERDWEGVWKLIDDAWTSTTTEPDMASMQQLIEYALAKNNGRQVVRLAQKLWTITSRNRLAANAITDEWIGTVLCSAVNLTSGLASSKNHPFVDFTFALFLIDVTPGGPRLDREQSRVLQCVNRLLASNSVRGAGSIKAELNAVTAKYVVPLKTDSEQSAQGPKWTRSYLKHGDKLLYPELKKWYIDAIARFEIPTIKNISQLLNKAQKHGDHEFWETVICQDFPKLMSALESTGLAKTDRLFKYYKKVVWSLAISTYASRKELDKVIAVILDISMAPTYRQVSGPQPSALPGAVSYRRTGGARLNVGTTLQSSVANARRRSTATTGGLWPGMRVRASIQARSIQDVESVEYNLDDLFPDEDETPPVVARATSSEEASARLHMLSAARANADGQMQPPPTRRQMFGMYLDSSAAGRRWDQLDALLNTAIAALHVYNTTHLKKHRLGVPFWALLTEAALSLLLLLQFLPRYLLAPDPLEYLRSVFSIITLVTSLAPICVVANVLLDPDMQSTFMSAGSWVFLYPVIFWRLQPALLRCLVPIKNVYRMTPMTRNVLRALTTVFTTVLAITVLTHIMVFYQNKDKDSEIQGFDEAFFFIAVSAITGLSSDIEPDTWFTRGVVLFVMFIGIFWLPPRVSEMLSLWQDRSPWPAAFEPEANQAHVLVIGDLEYSTLFEFLREFFCEDHGIRTVNTVVVVMSEKSPSKEVGELLHDPAYVNRAKFVLGSPTSFSQLEDIQADSAQAIFLLSSKAAGDNAAKEDAAKVMIALAVRKFLRASRIKRPVPIYAQVLLPETTMHMEYLAEHVICIEELRLGLLAKSVMVPGFASLLQLLTSSIPGTITDPLIRTAERGRKTWLAEYAQSMSHEIYSTRISGILTGSKFQRAAQVIFQRTGATLFALRIPSRDESGNHDGEGRIVINPLNYELQGDELGFVITSNSLASVEIAYLTEAATVNVTGSDDENAPLLLGVPIGSPVADAAAPEQTVGSPLKKMLADARLQPKVPFGMNVMDTLIVSDSGHSIHDDDDNDDRASHLSPKNADARSTATREERLIDIDGPAGSHMSASGNLLGSGLAGIVVDEPERRASGYSSDSDVSDSGAGGMRMHRAPLVYDPTLQKGSDSDLAAKHSEDSKDEEKGKDGLFKTPSGLLRAAGYAGSTGRREAAKKIEHTVDGLPGDLSGHIVVCDTSGEFPTNIVYLISCIRSAAPSEVTAIADSSANSIDRSVAKLPVNPFASLYEQISRSYNAPEAEKQPEAAKPAFLNMQTIVILSPADPSSDLLEDLQRFGNVHVVSGSPLSRADLARVRVHTASSAIVLANREEWLSAAADASTRLSLTGADTTATATADAPALLSVLNIEALTYSSADFFLSVEFIHRENMQFVGDTETLKINEVYGQAFLRPSFMSGRVYAPVMLDTLVCQAYYNEHLLEILQQLIFSHGNVTHALGLAKLRAAGVSTEAPAEADEDAAHVFLVETPRRFHGRSYGSLFSYCCFTHGAVAIGLYRAVLHRRQPLWYVMPNPAPDCVLRADDRVYLLANTRPTLE